MAGSSNEKWRLIWPFFLILILHCVAILLFTRGFLLTRTELSSFSHCADIFQSSCFPSPLEVPSTCSSSPSPRNFSETDRVNRHDRGECCWTKPAIDRLVIIVLDALRFDFVAPSIFFDEKKPWMDKLKVLQKLACDKGSSARIFKALADPPTTSLQRLKGLTTGGLPTFIDVGNSFGAPAIVEDNLIHQLVQNGKRVLMMGDDTWLQLFPDHFQKSYPYPSFNVKDLHTVDDGCIKHLLPSLYREDWDVLIAHFLGVDHAGHIFGVDSSPMVEKLEQYNAILEKVTEVLKNQSGPGDLHENTFLLVMGDHGQTTNGDHGGGTAEEVETSLFAMSMKKCPASVPAALDSSVCKLDLDGNKMCFSSVQQLDFAVTVAALLGVPFPFGRCSSDGSYGIREIEDYLRTNRRTLRSFSLDCESGVRLDPGASRLPFFDNIGRVNPEIYALAAGTWNQQSTTNTNCKDWLNLEEWMQNYAHVLCINSWQVKRYIDVYSASSVIGFSSEDLLHVEVIYAQALNNWSNSVQKSFLSGQETLNENFASTLSALEGQINTYSNFLASVAELARSKWTEFDLWMMGAGIGIMLFSLLVHFFAFRRAHMLCQATYPSVRASGISLRVVFAVFMVAMRACSFLSNSYILTEGKVANFLLGTTGILNLRYSIMKNKMLAEAVAFLLLISISRFIVEIGLSKQAVSAMLMSTYPLRMLGIDESHFFWAFISEIVPILALVFLAYLLYTTTSGSSCWRVLKIIFTTATVLSYMLIAVHWALESNMLEIPLVLEGIGRNSVPRIIYAIGCGLLVLLAVAQLFKQKGKTSDYKEVLVIKTVTMLSAWSSSIIILLGRQGFLVSLVSIIAGWCIIRLENLEQDTMNGTIGATDILSVTQWSLLAVSLFYLTGHWCAFDGLRYGAAFIGFDEFILVRQAILLAIETFGASHILPILALPFLVSFKHQCCGSNKERGTLFIKLSQVLLMYGLITAVTTSLTIVCVTIQRRHLMVWGLFAPKFVFDVVGLLLTDVLICLSSIYYFSGIDE